MLCDNANDVIGTIWPIELSMVVETVQRHMNKSIKKEKEKEIRKNLRNIWKMHLKNSIGIVAWIGIRTSGCCCCSRLI